MKTRIFAATLLIALLAVGAALLARPRLTQPSAPLQKQLDILSAKLEKLDREAAGLRRQVRQLQAQSYSEITASNSLLSTLPILNPASGSSKSIQSPLDAGGDSLNPSVPPGWKRFEFNGMTYYITPLAEVLETAK